jgi:hypothetical protein
VYVGATTTAAASWRRRRANRRGGGRPPKWRPIEASGPAQKEAGGGRLLTNKARRRRAKESRPHLVGPPGGGGLQAALIISLIYVNNDERSNRGSVDKAFGLQPQGCGPGASTKRVIGGVRKGIRPEKPVNHPCQGAPSLAFSSEGVCDVVNSVSQVKAQHRAAYGSAGPVRAAAAGK